MRPITSHHVPLSPSLSYPSSKLYSNEYNLDRLTWRGLSGQIGAGSFYPPNGSGASFCTRSGVAGTSTLVPTLFSDSVAVVMLGIVCVEGLMQFSAQSVVNSLIAAFVADIVVFF